MQLQSGFLIFLGKYYLLTYGQIDFGLFLSYHGVPKTTNTEGN